jgi:hypothetical protein
MSEWLNAAAPEPPEGTIVEDRDGRRWIRIDGAYGGDGMSNWMGIYRDGSPHGDVETWVKVAGNCGPVRAAPAPHSSRYVTDLRRLAAALRAAAGTPTHHNQEEENMSETAQVCDHPGIEHGAWSYTWPCPRCGVCRFIGHGPLCGKCYHETAPVPPVAEGKA